MAYIKSVFLRDWSLEDDAVAGILLFEDSDNDSIPSDSGFGDDYAEYAQKTKKNWSN
jgi:hypothetical protein